MTVHNNLAAEYYNQGRIEEAIATWHQALIDKADPIDLSGRC